MNYVYTSFVGVSLVFFPLPSEYDREWTRYQLAILGLQTKEIRAHLKSEKLLAVSTPDEMRFFGPFTVYSFDLSPGYQGLEIIAKNGLLVWAFEWSCTHRRTFFDEMNDGDRERYQQLRADYLRRRDK